MSLSKLEIVDHVHFKVGCRLLHKHWALDDWAVSALSQRGIARQLCLDAPSEFPSGRVPLYVCRCGDLQCGAVTVRVTEDAGLIQWEAFGREVPFAWEVGGTPPSPMSQSDYMARTGPFLFEREAYRYALSPFLGSRS